MLLARKRRYEEMVAGSPRQTPVKETSSFRVMARQLLRAIEDREFEQATMTVERLCSIEEAPAELWLELYVRLARLIWGQREPVADWVKRSLPWIDALQSRFPDNRFADWKTLLENQGGYSNSWDQLRPHTRIKIVDRLFTMDKSLLHETYVTVFRVGAFNADVVRILARECRMFVSKSQLWRGLRPTDPRLRSTNGACADEVMAAALLSWRSLTQSHIAEQCQITIDDLKQLVYLANPDRRRQLLDLVTSAAPPIVVAIEDLHPFYALPDVQSWLPWMHARVLSQPLHREWVASHNRRQQTGQQRVQEKMKQAMDGVLGRRWPVELLYVVLSFVFSVSVK